MSRFTWAPTAYKLLNGVFCIYKPENSPLHLIVKSIKLKLCRDLNALPCYKHEIVWPSQKKENVQENVKEKALSLNVEPKGIEDWSEHRLILGDRYEESDFGIHFIDGLSKHSTGVLVLGIGPFGRESVSMIAMSKFLRMNKKVFNERWDYKQFPQGILLQVYHVKGRFGWATHNYSPKGRILQRTSFKHVTRVKLDKVCATSQAAHTRQMYNLTGVHPDSQEAYEMASIGIIRPAERKTNTILYGIKCIDFQPPDFTLEIHSINESCPFLRQFIHELAVKLKTTAVCTGVRRVRYGTFDLRRALLRQQWHLDDIINNIESNNELLTPEKLFVGPQAERVRLPPPTAPNSGLLPAHQALIGEDEPDDFSEDGDLEFDEENETSWTKKLQKQQIVCDTRDKKPSEPP